MTTRILRSMRAFTIIEAMVTVLIATAATIGGVEMTAFVRTHNTMEQERARAQQIVTTEMEKQRHKLYTQISGGSNQMIWDNGTKDDPSDDTYGTLQIIVRNRAGTLLVAAPDPSVAVRVEVSLTWHPRGRRHGTTFRETAMSWIVP